MNNWTAHTLICLSIIALTGFAFYLTGSFWTFLILLLLPSMDSQTIYGGNNEVEQDEET